MKQKAATAIILGVMFLSLPLMFAIASVATSPFQVGRISDTPPGVKGGNPGPPAKEKGPAVSIAYPEDGATLYIGTHAVDVEATGDGIVVEVEIDGGLIAPYGSYGDYYSFYPWNVDTAGSYYITARATDENGVTSEATIAVTVVEAGTVDSYYELFIEIDYLGELGHEPNQAIVLAYIREYYHTRQISVTFIVDNNITNAELERLGIDPSDGINDNEFWALEYAYNDVHYYNDRKDASEDYSSYFQKEKWVLFGTTVEGQPNVLGYCYVVIQIGPNKDLLAGNWIYIADETTDNWAGGKGIEEYGAEAAVLMHELGHAIGIGVLKGLSEVYDPDVFSVMSYASTYNTGLYWAWHYSNKYWDTRNMEYYTI